MTFEQTTSSSSPARSARYTFDMPTLATLGYEGATIREVLDTLEDAKIETLVDVRAVAMSRRPGFAKTALSAHLRERGIEYLHFRALGTPAEGRAAARSGKSDVMRRIFLEHLATDAAQAELSRLVELVRGPKRVCILCFEADPAKCHRRIVAEALRKKIRVTVTDLRPAADE
jgi:uncharacterized protein (DUF488 family)